MAFPRSVASVLMTSASLVILFFMQSLLFLIEEVNKKVYRPKKSPLSAGTLTDILHYALVEQGRWRLKRLGPARHLSSIREGVKSRPNRTNIFLPTVFHVIHPRPAQGKTTRARDVRSGPTLTASLAAGRGGGQEQHCPLGMSALGPAVRLDHDCQGRPGPEACGVSPLHE